MDGEFSDWDEVSYLYEDIVGDVAAGGVDFGGLKILNDETFLYLYIELNFEINLQSFLNSTLYLDTDNNSATGLAIGSIGAELTWNFAAKSGMFYTGNNSTVIGHSDIRIRTFPTVSSEIFEISIGLDSKPDGLNDLFTGNTISVLFEDADNFDMLPDFGVNLVYTIQPVDLEPIMPIRISSTDFSHLRFLTWNVHGDDLFDPNLFDEYDRILSALNPEIIAFQEIYSHSSADLKELMESILPSGDGEEWFTLIDENDIALASRYEILDSWLPNSPNRAFLIKLKPTYAKDLLVIGAHTPCCANDAGRQNDIDGIMAFLRDAFLPGGVIYLEEDTPVILAGDFNLVGERSQLETLLTGDISDNSKWGSDFSPDWDGTNLSDAIPRHTDLLQTYTWQNDNSPFSPGRLDFIIYTDSAIKLEKSFVLRTDELSADTLNAYGLVASDTRL
ncbi:MAG: endonuclease/exonuclease/phosphatase family protein, partial [Candidatus Marinimicrobia bacterium]|nr:endonuclease/exonuclease/phosphatase family protein [Candidatus Neomarinimicrobiota bacterium]